MACRVVIRVKVTDIPGDVVARPKTLGQLFCQQILCREMYIGFNDKKSDFIHVLPNFDSLEPVNAWFLYDFEISEPLDELENVTHKVYTATKLADEWRFVERPQWVENAKKYTSGYKWGSY